MAATEDDGADVGSVRRSPARPKRLAAEEASLIEIWRQVLGRDDIGPEDDFSALGGDLIAAIGIVGEAEDRGLPTSTELLFSKRTARGVCAEFAERKAASATATDGKSFPVSHMQLG